MTTPKGGAPKGSQNRRRGAVAAKTMRRFAMDLPKNWPAAAGLTALERITIQHLTQAMEGDMPSIKEVYERLDGKVTQVIAGDPDAPLEIEHKGSALDVLRNILASDEDSGGPREAGGAAVEAD